MAVPGIFSGPGKQAFLENVRSAPRKTVGDPAFDSFSSDIFTRLDAEDERLLTWNRDFKAVIGLYDQATQGILHHPETWKGHILIGERGSGA
jgi:hypothetical protein